jgi:hypothetical protein
MKKTVKQDCYCALCRTPRVVRYGRKLTPQNYAQIVLVTATLTWLLFNALQWKTLGAFFIIWAAFDLSKKLLYRRDLKCKACGFDPTWYKRDVRVARRQVETHLRENPDSPLLRVSRHRTTENSSVMKN